MLLWSSAMSYFALIWHNHTSCSGKLIADVRLIWHDRISSSDLRLSWFLFSSNTITHLMDMDRQTNIHNCQSMNIWPKSGNCLPLLHVFVQRTLLRKGACIRVDTQSKKCKGIQDVCARVCVHVCMCMHSCMRGRLYCKDTSWGWERSGKWLFCFVLFFILHTDAVQDDLAVIKKTLCLCRYWTWWYARRIAQDYRGEDRQCRHKVLDVVQVERTSNADTSRLFLQTWRGQVIQTQSVWCCRCAEYRRCGYNVLWCLSFYLCARMEIGILLWNSCRCAQMKSSLS